MIDYLTHPWPWYISGIAIAAIMVTLLFWGKSFGFSSNFRTLCSIAGAGKRMHFFNFDWRTQRWNLLFLLGAIGGGTIASSLLNDHQPLALSAATISDLKQLNIPFDGDFNPSTIFTWEHATTVKGMIILLGGGLLVGFGSRYAGGCTSGHAISGLSNLQLPSLYAVIGFFIGGLAMTHLLFPLIF
jgi:uncharacterized membrane protein YedE/YeeE